MASLVVMGPPATGARFPLALQREVVIGRSGFCDIVLNKRSVSREHARIFDRDGRFFIQDMESINGTFLNGRPVREPAELRDGDRINLFDVPLAFYAFDDVATPAHGMTPPEMDTVPRAESPNERSRPSVQTRLDNLVEIAQRLGSSLNVEEILPKILDVLFRMFPQAVNGEILLVDTDGKLTPRASKLGRDDDSANLTVVPYNREFAAKALKDGAGFVECQGDSSEDSVLEGDFTSAMYVPIIVAAKTPLGVIVLETEDVTTQFSEEDLNLVGCVATMAAQALGYARAHQSVIEHERTRQHLETARDIQLRMLPRECPQVSGYKFAHYYRAAQQVGGDAYVYHTLPDGRIVLGIADASGKGLPACLKIIEFISELRHCVSTATSLKSAMEYLNRFVCKEDDGGFITFCLAVLDPQRHTLSIVNAGHPLPLLRHPTGEVTALGAGKTSFPLGLEPAESYHPFTVPVAEGDEFIVFTDGVTEAFNCDDEAYGDDRLKLSVSKAAGDAKQRAQSIVADVEQFRQGRKPSDDLCVVVLARSGS